MNSYLMINELRIESIRKVPQDQLYFDKSNLFFISAKRKLLHDAKHKFIQNIMAQELKPKYKLNNPIYTR
jgi:hypothetical protein